MGYSSEATDPKITKLDVKHHLGGKKPPTPSIRTVGSGVTIEYLRKELVIHSPSNISPN